MNRIIRETGLHMSLEFHYKYLVLLYVEADEKLEVRKHYYGLTYTNNQLITRGIETRRHDSPASLKSFNEYYFQGYLISMHMKKYLQSEILSNMFTQF